MQQRNDLEFYDRVAHEWWSETAKIYALSHLNAPRFEYFDRYISTWQGLKVLDVGCGGGFTCEFLATRGAVVSGIDQSQNLIDQAQQHAAVNQLPIDYRHGYGEELPYTDRTFDVVVCVDVLEHVADLQQTVSEIHRVLKPGGFFCFDTINRTFKSKLIMIWLLEDWLRQIPHGVHDWQKFIKPEELAALMVQLGFHDIEFAGFNIFGETMADNVRTYLHYQRTKTFEIGINQDTSVMYIGKARKSLS
ncbi:bifunctional 2-polyprenyl-6-hydroxyphenol methylase/3-demethylubiquinol 3-O-methyltransferase UbiG [Pseudanabaena sp. FACHB-2040]|uniref:bifunctional 2-polyprenyl-6-hydroxyphenol methylase/3-demethylubiquinol 3-O-methyltransferase UbiG n=1 Tax=Pseudanabaena sp. FACHB-2040 TaxID=2692859 RepID=UPI00168316A9|nr:bifunctional 2-polyprenyl-6-hydroxyphenol methylase/3-demethylubiquinol 3-O-methyltransferase UbiG [Pseudanabaena sp. FACHB-2040]MBD2256941.1 3-demethylubiquinone-9 3-O-methyltransferase [Pseudanabaena sp. FACHB-2040]